MLNLIKYELRSTFLTILGICVSVILGSLFLIIKRNDWDMNMILGLSVTLIITALVVIFISSLKIISKYLYEDSGYLLFTLPQSGKSIMTSRLITALIQTSIVVFVCLLMFYLTIASEVDLNFLKEFKFNVILFTITQYIWGIFSSLTLIYFSMIIGKVALKGKKLGKIGSFIIFIVISSVIGLLSFKINTIFPQTFNLGDFSMIANYKVSTLDFTGSNGAVAVNIASMIFDIITFVVFFISSSYLIDKKLDLS